MTISFSQWISKSISTIRSGNRSLPARLFCPLYNLYVGGFLTATHRYPYGTPIFEKEWDTLIVLDACRVDALREVADEYEFLGEIDSIRSVGSTSFEWLNHTFSVEYLEEIRRTGYVTGNGYTERVFDNDGHTGNAAIPFVREVTIPWSLTTSATSRSCGERASRTRRSGPSGVEMDNVSTHDTRRIGPSTLGAAPTSID